VQTIQTKTGPVVLLGLIDHERRDGTLTQLYHWRKHCQSPGCASVREFKSTARNRDGALVPPEDPSRHYDPRFTYNHCAKHWRAIRPKTKRRTKPCSYASRTRVSAEDVQTMRDLASGAPGPRMKVYQALAVAFGVTAGTAREIVAGRKR